MVVGYSEKAWQDKKSSVIGGNDHSKSEEEILRRLLGRENPTVHVEFQPKPLRLSPEAGFVLDYGLLKAYNNGLEQEGVPPFPLDEAAAKKVYWTVVDIVVDLPLPETIEIPQVLVEIRQKLPSLFQDNNRAVMAQNSLEIQELLRYYQSLRNVEGVIHMLDVLLVDFTGFSIPQVRRTTKYHSSV